MGYDFEGKRVFLSGPMTGMDDWNRAEFARVAAAVRQRGAAAVFDPALDAPPGEDDRPHAHWMLRTLSALCDYSTDGRLNVPTWDVLVLLDGWEASAGARTEHVVALACGIEYVEWRECE